MPVNDAYATAEVYRGVISKTDTGEDAEVLTDLTAISRYLEKKLGRFFNKDAAPVARVFTSPAPSRILLIDDLAAAPSSVIVDLDMSGALTDTPLTSTQYELSPVNALLGPEPEPYTAICIPSWSTAVAFMPGQRVQVTGTWGWPDVPEPIKRATIHLTAILRLETPRATQQVSEMGDRIGTSRAAQSIIDELTKRYEKKRLPVFF